MLTLHVTICFIALFTGAIVLISQLKRRQQPSWAAVLLFSTVLISLTGFALPSPPGTPTPDPARTVGVLELVLVVIAALALYVKHLAHGWRGTYVATIVLAAYFNVFVAVTQGFLKIGFLHALAPTGKEPAFLITQLLTLVLFVVVGVLAFKRFQGSAVAAATLADTGPDKLRDGRQLIQICMTVPRRVSRPSGGSLSNSLKRLKGSPESQS